MVLKTRGSIALDKAQRRLALLKSIDHLDLGYGLTIDAYQETIETTRDTLEAYNTLLSKVEEYRKLLAQMDANLSTLSERMLNGVATKYGKQSMEYAKAGGSNRKRGKSSTSATATTVTPSQPQALPPIVTNSAIASNGSPTSNGAIAN